jgi:ribosomal protein S18 acetylase RimI-like enzyme
MEIITVDQDNIEREHICCAISDKKGETCVELKKAWMKERFRDGLTFRKLDARGKVFIECIPAEKAWCPVSADGYMHINCFWVSGQFKGQGYANRLLEQCITDAEAKGKLGLTALSSVKKMPFLSDPGYLKHKGFMTADAAKPYYELLYLPFADNAPVPQFKDCVKRSKIDEKGMVLYYSDQCPFADKYAEIIRGAAERRGTTVKLYKIESTEEAQNAPAPFTTYSFFYNGDFITNEIFSEKKFEKFLDDSRIG